MPGNYYAKLVISDTSCIIALTNIGRLDVLKELCRFVCITPEVASEFRDPLPEWIHIVPVKDASTLRIIRNSLDLGEASAIALSLETENSLVILDDGRARRFAKNIGVAMTGTLGVLITAFEAGILPDIYSVIAELRKKNFRLPAHIDTHLK
jgi:predicted nucleic acid-binding protein